MRILWIGYGQAGGKIANTLMGMEERFRDAIVINTEAADLTGLYNINKHKRIIIGKYKQNGRGVGTNIALGAEIAQKSLSQMMDRIVKLSRILDPEAFWVVAGMAGGTGGGGAHVLAKELKSKYDKPVYGLGVLPSTTGMPVEKEVLYLSNALKSLESWRKHFDNILLVDNEQYELKEETHESITKMYQRINKDVTKRLTLLLTAGEASHSSQEVLSASEIKATLGKDGDISTIGYRCERIKLRTRFWRQGIEPDTKRLEDIIKESISKEKLTFPCDVHASKAAALLLYGRSKHIFAHAIIAARTYLEQEMKIGEVRHGDYPDRTSTDLGAITLVSGVADFSKLERMRKRIEEVT